MLMGFPLLHQLAFSASVSLCSSPHLYTLLALSDPLPFQERREQCGRHVLWEGVMYDTTFADNDGEIAVVVAYCGSAFLGKSFVGAVRLWIFRLFYSSPYWMGPELDM